RTRRCFVTACRVTSVPAVSRVIESGPSALSRATRRRRVSSPRAAKSGAASASAVARLPALALAKVLRDVPDLAGPALRVHPVGLRAPSHRDAVEARFDDA